MAWYVYRFTILILVVLTSAVVAQNPEQDVRRLGAHSAEGAYAVENGAVVFQNGDRYHNRPLYCNHLAALVLAGDRPSLRLVCDPYVYGCFMLAYVRGDRAVWLHEARMRKSLYRSGRMEWRIADPGFEGVNLTLECVPDALRPGMAEIGRAHV